MLLGIVIHDYFCIRFFDGIVEVTAIHVHIIKIITSSSSSKFAFTICLGSLSTVLFYNPFHPSSCRRRAIPTSHIPPSLTLLNRIHQITSRYKSIPVQRIIKNIWFSSFEHGRALCCHVGNHIYIDTIHCIQKLFKQIFILVALKWKICEFRIVGWLISSTVWVGRYTAGSTTTKWKTITNIFRCNSSTKIRKNRMRWNVSISTCSTRQANNYIRYTRTINLFGKFPCVKHIRVHVGSSVNSISDSMCSSHPRGTKIGIF